MKSLREIVLADLERGMRLMLVVQDEIDPQFRIATPEGDVALAVTFPAQSQERLKMFERLRRFCALRQALAYTMTFGMGNSDALMTVGVAADKVVTCTVRYTGQPGSYTEDDFGEPDWLEQGCIGQEFLSLLPKRASVLTKDELAELEVWFGAEGFFPAVGGEPMRRRLS